MFREKTNPIGKVHTIKEIESKLKFYSEMWDSLKNKKSFWNKSVDLSRVTNFLLFALDDFINTINKIIIPGADKKATVLYAIDRLYDYTVREAFPIWLRPFAAPIKNYIIYVLISSSIDWIVQKYNSGVWYGAASESSALLRILKKAGCADLSCRVCSRRNK